MVWNTTTPGGSHPSPPVPPPSTPTPVLSSAIPSGAPENPNASSPPVQSPSHSHNDTCNQFTNLQPTNQSTKSCWSIAPCST
ncbi:hypothetical protein O181_062585 [Austropuccinia psidii MF-1]|uniref:Uncharacterized protein n=1 Tax=Austropuccinia psidii MF-1 TaxID=1389203 RepID=A0A9Q3EH85_9BASI|nr:hypothetical protein [Austropuccinia psidii MF-1]